MKYRVFSAFALLLAVSCSVKEDRTGCACILTVDLSPCAGQRDNIFLTLITEKQVITGDYVPGEDNPLYEYEVAKGECCLTAYSGVGLSADGFIRVASGEQFPEVSAYVSIFSALEETALQRVTLHKQYACITLDLSESGWDSTDFSFEVYGDVCGFALTDLRPVKGPFFCLIPSNTSSFRSFRVPRQLDNSLKIRVVDKLGAATELSVGKLMEESGYDWTAEDLEDAVITVSGSDNSVSVEASDWDFHAPVNVSECK